MDVDPIVVKMLRDCLMREGWPASARSLPSDRGGLTRGGITARSWGRYMKLGRDATEMELNAIDEPSALNFYFDEYVRKPRFGEIADARLRELLVDWAFTSWSDDPTKALQRALVKQGKNIGSVDGVIGDLTLAAVNSTTTSATTLYRDVFTDRVRFYVALAIGEPAVVALMKRDPYSQLHNLTGWVNRALQFAP